MRGFGAAKSAPGWAAATRALIEKGEEPAFELKAEEPPQMTRAEFARFIGRAAIMFDYEALQVYHGDKLLLQGRRGDGPEKWKTA